MALDRKIACIDLTSGEIEIKPIPLKMRQSFLGGRGLDMYLVYNHITPGIDPLGPDNVAVVSAGILAGTLALAAARAHVSGKSPLTGLAGSADVGGFFAPELRWAGFDHLVIKGKAKKPVYLWVQNGEIEIRDARNAWGKMVNEAQQAIREELGDRDVQILTIGPTGEKLVRLATVMTELKDTVGRSGMGALFGSKNLKAIAARGTMDIKIAHPAEALDYNYRVISQTTPVNQPEDAGAKAGAINEYSVGMASCFGCQAHCRTRYVIPSGPYAGVYDEGPACATQGASASKPDSQNSLTMLVGNHLTNSYGIDPVETASLIMWATELYENGILTDKDTHGLELRSGNDDAVIEMVHRIAQRKGLGNILAEGLLRAAEKIGNGSIKYLTQVKGMSSLSPDKRPTPALALAIATASSGSDCPGGYAVIDRYSLPEPSLRQIYSQPVAYDGPLTPDQRDYEGKAWPVFWQETAYGAADCLGICKYYTTLAGATPPHFEEWSKLLYYNTGLEMSPLDIWTVAERAHNMERLFNIREGLTRKDDWLASRYFDEPARPGTTGVRGEKLDREKFQKMIDEYYKYHGWDKNGVPTRKTLTRLGIDNEPSHSL
jgi:aldehyde:ferredoxin oxidoreductase